MKNLFEIDFNDAIILLYRNKFFLIKSSLFNIIVCLLFYFITSNIYTSSFTLLPSEPQKVELNSSLALLGLDPRNLKSEETFTSPDLVNELFKSRSYAYKLLSKEVQIDNLGNTETIYNFLNRDYSIQDNFEKNYQSLIENLIFIEKDIETGIYYIKVSSKNPYASYHICNAVLKTLTDFRTEILLSQTFEEKEFLTMQINKLNIEMNISENNLLDFVNSNNTYLSSPALKLKYDRIKNNLDLISSLYWAYKQDLEILKLKEVSIASGLVVVDNPVIDKVKKYPTNNTFLSLFILTFIFLNIPYTIFINSRNII